MDAIIPMEAKLVEAPPDGPGWQFEPKWDGFRCIAVRDADGVRLLSKAGKPLGRYFPEVVALLERVEADAFVLDGELIIPADECLSFEALQARLHPADSRIRKLAAETPAQYMLFDLLTEAARPLGQRRAALETFHRRHGSAALLLSPATESRAQADAWLARSGGALDGVVAKRLDEPYRPGERAMLKVKQLRTADCVVGGFRYAAGAKVVGSLLLGLFGEDGRLHHVGFCPPPGDKGELTRRLETTIEPPGFSSAGSTSWRASSARPSWPAFWPTRAWTQPHATRCVMR